MSELSKPIQQGNAVKAPTLDTLKQINLNAAGLDVGASEIYVCVPEGRDEQLVRVFETFTPDLRALADWLKQCQVTTVAMEATGVYWIPIFQILESYGFEVYLVNAHHIKNVRGKKTDILDCQWIQQLHTYGLLQASFRPNEQICALRSLVRHREMLLRCRASHIQHMQKALQQMNLQLTQVLSDITGATGLLILRTIVAGNHDPQQLAQYRHQNCTKSETDIAKALTGDYRPEHLFALQQALELYDCYSDKIQICEQHIEHQLAQLNPQLKHPLPPKKSRKRRKTKNQLASDLRQQLHQIAGVDLTAIDGLNVLIVQTILSEIGTDMSKWPTVKHFTSWLGLSPQNDKTGGKVVSSRTRKTTNRANLAFRQAAVSLKHSQSALGVFYRRMRAKLGTPKAVVAAAHKLARIVYTLLKYRVPYQALPAEQVDRQYQQRLLHRLQKQAQQLGAQLILPSEPLST